VSRGVAQVSRKSRCQTGVTTGVTQVLQGVTSVTASLQLSETPILCRKHFKHP
jgi:hypothetical protein